MPEAAILLLLIIVGLGLLLLLRSRWQRLTIYEWQQALRYRQGRFVDLVGPGQHWIYKPTTSVRVVDARTTVMAIPGQEVITSDAVSLKVSLGVQQRLVDPQKAIHEVDDYSSAIYNILQVALRETVGAHRFEELLGQREIIGPDVLHRSAARAAAVGIELVAVDVKDLMLSPSTKRAYSQVVEARQQGLAALEKARGETAALRSLANAARMVEGSPALLQLRWMQQLESKPGNTVILDMASGASTASLAARAAQQNAGEPEPVGEVDASDETA
jgi:regulator of protease activity HflC (stomatin/prohibitin superfamily)